MGIRKATKEDVLDIVLLTKQFLREFKPPIKLDSNHFVTNLNNVIESPEYFFYVSEHESEVVGYLSGAKNYTMFSSQPMAIEIGWFMSPEYRGSKDGIKLLSKFEEWAKENECEVISMGDLAKVQDLGSLYNRRGFELYERTYIKEI
jgi:GNAT superfamily N-acetyltransferase